MSKILKLSAHPRLSSPGSQTSARARLERVLLADGNEVLATFLADVQASAGRGDVTLGHVHGSWAAAVKELASRVDLDPTAVQRLLASSVPGEVFQSMGTLIHTSREERWPAARLHSELALAFDPSTGTRLRLADGSLEDTGMSWQAQFDRSIRTEATADYARYTQEGLGEAGYARKRWVAHYDQTTRPTHLEASGQTVALGGEFLVGGSALAFPGDPAAPFSETMNCRCVMVGIAT